MFLQAAFSGRYYIPETASHRTDENVMENPLLFFRIYIRMKKRDKKGRDNMDKNQTQHFSVVKDELDVHRILEHVYEALEEKGYNPVNQMVGYIMSGDPTYITSHKNARSMINKVERDEIIEALFVNYIDTRLK